MPELERHATNLVDVVYGNEVLRYDDPTENWFEVTKIYRPSMAWDAPGVSRLLRSPILQEIATRAGKKFDDLPLLKLPAPLSCEMSLNETLSRRRSAERFSGDPVTLEQLATVLANSYGEVRRAEGIRRPVPSGGALYPLDLYVLSCRVEGLEHGAWYFDARRDGLTRIGDFDEEDLGSTLLQEEAVAGAAVTIIVAASFWRSRFKYGPRSSRFILIEAGHVVQNMALSTAALGLAGRPYGGFVDDELSGIIGLQNGVDDAPLYTYVMGTWDHS